LKRRNCGEEMVSGVNFGPGRKMTGSDQWGLLVSEKKRIEGEDTNSVEVSGPRARARPRWAAVFLFHFFFDLIPFSFSVFFKTSYPFQI
jgi:hypothetical protein